MIKAPVRNSDATPAILTCRPPCSAHALAARVWGDHAVIEERTVDVHVLRLRKALKEADSLIRTVRSVGYMLSVLSEK